MLLYRLLFVLLTASLSVPVLAQSNPFMSDANGSPLFWGSNYRQEGSPYFHDEYIWAEITSTGGKVYKDVRIKFNIVDLKVQYLAEDGSEMLAAQAIRSIRFPALKTEDGSQVNIVLVSSTGVLNHPDAKIYQVLDSGKVSLLKKISITYRDEKKYGDATITRHYDRKETEYLRLANGEYEKLEKSRTFILTALADKRERIDNYITNNNIKCKSTKDFQRIIIYYNSLE